MSPRAERRRLAALFGTVAALNAVGWGGLSLMAPRHPGLVGLGALAFTFGLRHALDADHIAAIDNATRKLLHEGRPAEGTGLYFSLGHSTVVTLMALTVAAGARFVTDHLPTLEQLGAVVGTAVAGTFLYLIAAVNLVVLADVYRLLRELRRGTLDEESLESRLRQRGLLNRLLGRVFRTVTRAWHLYPVGLLFGLGFDTASEVALLAMAATAGSQHAPALTVAVLPALFAAGMTLVDTADGVFMVNAYGWAFAHPVRRVYYNLTMTGLSVLLALLVGTVELAQVVSGQLHLDTGLWATLQGVDVQVLGYLVVGLFVLTWGCSYLFWKVAHLEERWGMPVAQGSPRRHEE